jgi:ribosomal protein L37AE/L43A
MRRRLACERRFAAQQAAVIRERLEAKTECPTCSDVALRRMEAEIRIVRPRSDQQSDGARTTIVTPVPARPRYP